MENTGLSYLSSSVQRSNYQSSTGQKDCIPVFFKCHHPQRNNNKTPRNLQAKPACTVHSISLKNSICISRSTMVQLCLNSATAAITSMAYVSSITEYQLNLKLKWHVKVEEEATDTESSNKSSCARLTGKSHAFPRQKNKTPRHNSCFRITVTKHTNHSILS